MPTGVEIANAYVALQVKMPGAARTITAELGKAEGATTSVGRNIGSSILSGVGAVLKGGVVAVGTVAGAALGTALIKGFGRLNTIDTARAQLTGLGHDAGVVQTVMGNALAAVKGTAFGLGDASTVAAQLVAAQIKPGEQLEGTLKSVANSAAAAQVGIGEMGSIYAKVASVGKAQNDSLQQVAERGIPIYQELARSLGVSTDEVFKLASEGKINFDLFSSAMTTAAGTVATEMGNTVGGSWANFIASLGRIGAGLMSGLFPKVTPAIQAMTTALGPLEEIAARAGDALGKWLGPWIDSMTAWVAAIDFTKVESGVIGIYNLVAKGDFTGKFREAFNLEEDSRTVTVILGIRNAIVGLYDLVVNGNFSTALREAFHIEEDSGFVTFVLGMRDAVGSFFSSLTSGDFSGAASSIGASLQTLSPALSEFGAQLPKVGQAAAKITAGGVDVLTNVLSFLADNVDTIIQFMPLIVAGFIAWRVSSAAVANATLALRAAELAATPIYFANNVMRNNSVRIERQLAAAKAASTVSTNTAAASTTRSTIATLAASTAARVAAAGQWLLNAALSANPIGIIIVAITALVGALVWFFTQTELGQQIWSNVMGAIGAAATWLWETILQPVFAAIGAVFGWIWDNIISPIGTLIVNYFRFWGAVAVWLWQNVLSPVFAAIGQVFQWIWATVIEPIIGYVVSAIQGWGIVFDWLYKNIVKPVFDGISSVMGAAWSWIDQNVFAPFKVGISLLGTAFENVSKAIGIAWDAIKAAAAAPINFVLDTVWNNGLRSFWNDLVGTLGLNDMKLPKADLVKFADGGVENHVAQIARGGAMRLWAEPETGGEAYIPLSPAKRARSTAILADVAQRFGFGLTQFANGGITGGEGGLLSDVWEHVRGAATLGWEFLSNPGAAIQKHVIDGILKPMLEGQNIFGQTVGGLAINTVKSMAGLFAASAPQSDSPAGRGMGWESMWKIIQGALPGTQMYSNYRPNDPYSRMHSLGRAIDLTPSMQVFNWIRENFPNSQALIYSPANGRQLLEGKNHLWGEPERSMHYNHVHWAMADGGVIPKLYDEGGWLPHGGMALNLSGRPEPVFTGEQWDTLRASREQGAAVIVHGDLVTQDVPDLFRQAEKNRRRRAAVTATQREIT